MTPSNTSSAAGASDSNFRPMVLPVNVFDIFDINFFDIFGQIMIQMLMQKSH